MENNHPKYSIIIRCYNNEDYIERCIVSAIKQTYKNFEIIIIDDESIDKSFSICNKYAKQHSEIKLFQTKHSERTHARNLGLKKSSGTYIIYLDGDDWLDINSLELCEEILKEHNSKPEMIVFKWREINENNINTKFNDTNNKASGLIRSHDYIKDNVQEFIPNADLTASFFLRNLIINHYCKDESIIICEDNAYTYETLYNAKYVYFSENTVYNYNRIKYFGPNRKVNKGLEEFSKLGNYVFNNLGKQYTDEKLHKQLTKWFYDYFWIRMPEFFKEHDWNGNNASKAIIKNKNLALDKLARNFIPYKGIKLRDKLTWFLIKHKMYKTYFFIYKLKNKK